MLRSRMFTTSFRFFAALSAASLVAAFVSAFSSSKQSFINSIVGPLTIGWKGGVGNHFVYAMFLGLAIASGFLALLLVAFRDADPEAQAQVVHTESVPLTRAPSSRNFVPPVAGFAVVVTMVGLVTDRWFVLAGVALLVVTGFVWTLRSWAERATGDDEVNREIYHRFIDPLRVPVVAAVVIGVVVLGLSRELLSVSKTSAVVLFGLVGLSFLLVTLLIASRPALSKAIITIIVIVGAIAVIGGGIIGLVKGERTFEQRSGQSGSTEGGLGPIVVSSRGD